ncbi:glycosyltransferase [Amycolatopsis sp. RTGN1]|uniref:glycosyltransferase n=1 Tax=Amycolatopsis ponsaeliensis TaxID=2992142 RepID=UPI00254E26A3|nr:glycosyltransferase [Amycolatopsis sp. RTGN1]
MTRFLVVVPPFTGHVNPIIGVAEELRNRGHEVSWAGDETVLARTLPGRWPIHACASPSPGPRPPHLRGYAALKHLWDDVLLPLAEAMVPGVRQAVRHTRPDVVLTDQQALAGALVAERAGLPWATSASTSAELTDPLAAMPRVRDWLVGRLGELRHRHGVPGAGGDLRFSPHLVLAFTTPALAGDVGPAVRFVGPVPRPPASDDGFPWERLDTGRLSVLVTMGTVNADVTEGFLRECVAALDARPELQGVLADPGNRLRELDGDFIRLPWLPVPELLPHAAAVVCHGGHNTVCESLASGVPLVVAPIRDDQPVIAGQVATTGAGVRLRFPHSRAELVGHALDQVGGDPAFAAAADLIRKSFVAAGGAPAAADALEDLAAGVHDSRETRA